MGLMPDLRRCTRCVLPETHETIVFDDEGVCNICRGIETKQEIDWRQRRADLGNLIEEHRGRAQYDCIVPFSGGKDSSWTLYYLVKEFGIKPLVVTFDHGFLRPQVRENTQRTLKELGCDHLSFTPNWHVVRLLMLQSFLEKGDFCWHCHTGIFSYPMWVALEKQVPLIVWGEPSAEYTAYYSYDQPEEVDEKRFNRSTNLGISAADMAIRLGGKVEDRDLKPFTYPPLRELRRLGYRSVCLGSYVPWDVKTQVAIIERELGWRGDHAEGTPPSYDYEKIECRLQGVRDYIKYIKRGYARPAHLASIDVRHGRLSRKEAMDLVENYEGIEPASLAVFLEFVGLSRAEFMEIAMSHVVSPWGGAVDVGIGPKPHDYDDWIRGRGLAPAKAEEQLRQYRDRHVGQSVGR